MISIPIRTAQGQNAREHHMARSRRVKRERQAVQWLLNGQPKPPLPCLVELTRVSPAKGRMLDDDNLSGALKAVRDQIAEWLGVDDGDTARVRYAYSQRKGPWGVEIEFRRRVVVKTDENGAVSVPAGLLSINDVLEVVRADLWDEPLG